MDSSFDQSFTALLCDNDGTLVDTEPLYWELLSQIVPEWGGHTLEPLFYARYIGGTYDPADFWSEVGLSDYTPERWQEFFSSFIDRSRPFIAEHARLSPFMREILESPLFAPLPKAIVTNAPQQSLLASHGSLEVMPLFQSIVTLESTSSPKPAPDPYLLACKKLGVAPRRQVLCLEDSPGGVRSGLSAGLTVWAVSTVTSTPADLSEAHRVFSSHEELYRFLSSPA